MDSPASASELSFSDASVLELGSQTTSPVLVATKPGPKASTSPEYEGVNLFEPGDGDIQITVNGTSFESHKYLIKRFQGLKLLLGTRPLEINIQRNDISAEDFCEMFKVLYASIVTGPFVFTSNTLISTLRVATIYEYHALRNYCIQHLETLELDAVKRIELAYEFRLPEWETPAYQELGMREKAITREEAKAIGLDAFVIIAEIREKEQRRRGKEIDAAGGERDTRSPTSGSLPSVNPGEISARDDTQGSNATKPPPAPTPSSCDAPEEHSAAAHTENNGVEVGLSLADIKLNGLGLVTSRHGYYAEVPSCQCGSPVWKCRMPACTILALKDIQAQQQTQANRISDLESSARRLNNPVTSKYVPTSLRAPPIGFKPTAREFRAKIPESTLFDSDSDRATKSSALHSNPDAFFRHLFNEPK